MPDLLVVTADTDMHDALTAVGESRGFRVKATTDLTRALEWLGLREFQAVVADSSLELAHYQKLAEAHWKRNLQAGFVVWLRAETANKALRAELRLLGIEVATSREEISSFLAALPRSIALTSEGLHVLVVEDLDSPRDIICAFIERLGYPSVSGVSSVQEAIETLSTDPKRFSCVITDINMPRVSGKEMIAQIRADDALKHLPIIVLTAYGTAECLIDCLRAGASGFLVKPPARSDLQRELGRALRILSRQANPRLASEADTESLMEILEQRGLV